MDWQKFIQDKTGDEFEAVMEGDTHLCTKSLKLEPGELVCDIGISYELRVLDCKISDGGTYLHRVEGF